MSSNKYDVAVIGGGIVGLSTARALARSPGNRIVVLEAEERIAAHQTGNNSGVIHSGVYYRPGSLKADNCARGRDAMYDFCRENEIPHERCGKVIVAVQHSERETLREIERRGIANGLTGIRRIGPDELTDLEPHAAGIEALYVPQTGIVDFGQVAAVVARQLVETGVEVRTESRVETVVRESGRFLVRTPSGELSVRNLINCAGLQCDRVARMCGVNPGIRVIPFRGEYHRLVAGREGLVRNLVYPVPDPALPFLGSHLTRRIDGTVEAGPNAVLALSRRGYRRGVVSPRDCAGIFGYAGFWRLARRHFRYGAAELRRSLSRKALARDLRRLVPEITALDLEPHGAGVRAQAVTPDGRLLDDFHIVEAERMLHLLNAPSPAATASLSIGATLAKLAVRCLDLPG